MSCHPHCITTPKEHRAFLKCGWVPKDKWREGETRRVPGCELEPTVCPGYSTTLPQVYEVANAWAWWGKSQLTLRHPDPPPTLLDLIEIFNASQAEAEGYEMDEIQRKGKMHG